MQNFINIYVVWAYDGPVMTTLLKFEDSEFQRQALQSFTTEDYIRMAFHEEFEESFKDTDSYELVAIFESNDIRFIY